MKTILWYNESERSSKGGKPMKKIEKMESILHVITKAETCTRQEACRSCLEHHIVSSEEEFEKALRKLQKKGCITIEPETENLIFKRPYSYLRQKGSVKYNGTTNRIFFFFPSQPFGRH